jgi:hypothetical protein
MRKLRRVTRIQDVNALPVTPAPVRNSTVAGVPARETLASFTREYNRAEQERQAAEQRRIEAAQREREDELARPLREAVKESSRKLTMFWNKPLSVIRDFGVDLSPIDMIGDYIIMSEANVWDSQLDVRAHKQFKADLESRGCTLSSDGWDRLGGFLEALRFHRQISLAVVANWQQALDRLVSLGVFQPGEISGYQVPQPATEPAVRHERNDAPTMADLLAIDAGTQEGQRAARQIGDDLYVQEMLPLYREWIDLIRTAFGHVVTRKDADLINAWFAQNNKSWLRHESYNECRRYLVSIHHWPDSMLTPEEKALTAIESLERPAGMSDYEYRKRAQALAR